MTDKLQAEKEAIASLEGASKAISSALSRVNKMEAQIKDQVAFLSTLQGALGINLHAQFYNRGDYKIQPISEVIGKQIEKLKGNL